VEKPARQKIGGAHREPECPDNQNFQLNPQNAKTRPQMPGPEVAHHKEGKRPEKKEEEGKKEGRQQRNLVGPDKSGRPKVVMNLLDDRLLLSSTT
jgi:hypothetical protein